MTEWIRLWIKKPNSSLQKNTLPPASVQRKEAGAQEQSAATRKDEPLIDRSAAFVGRMLLCVPRPLGLSFHRC